MNSICVYVFFCLLLLLEFRILYMRSKIYKINLAEKKRRFKRNTIIINI